MMCGMCECHVDNLIRKNFDSKKVKSSHTKNESSFISKDDITESIEIQNITKEISKEIIHDIIQ